MTDHTNPASVTQGGETTKDKFADCPRTTAAMRQGLGCKPDHWYTTADFSDSLEREIATLKAERDATVAALERERDKYKATVEIWERAPRHDLKGNRVGISGSEVHR